MTDLNSFQSINLSQFFDSVKFRSGSGSGYHLVIDFCIVMFYMIMILMKFSFLPQTFFRIFFFFLDQDQDHEQAQDFTMKFIRKKYSLYAKDIFGFQYQTYVSYIDDTHQILFRSANSFKSYCVHMKSPRTYIHPDTQTDRQTYRQTDGNFFWLVLSSKTYKS